MVFISDKNLRVLHLAVRRMQTQIERTQDWLWCYWFIALDTGIFYPLSFLQYKVSAFVFVPYFDTLPFLFLLYFNFLLSNALIFLFHNLNHLSVHEI